VTATPDVTPEFDSWGGGQCSSSTATTCTVTLDAPAKPLTATFRLKNVLVPTPGSLGFGDLADDSYSSMQSVTVQNTGSFTTGLLSTSLTGGNSNEFVIVSNTCSGQALASNATCSIGVLFTPTTTGGKSTSLQLAGSPGGTSAVPLTGNSLGYISVNPLLTYPSTNPSINDLGALQGGPSHGGTAFGFYSNRAGGLGGFDIWVATRNGSSWNSPVNSQVNTAADELHPFIFGTGAMLFVRNNTIYRGSEGPPPFYVWTMTSTGLAGHFPSVTADGQVLYFIDPTSPPKLMRSQLSGGTWQAAVEQAWPSGHAYLSAQISADERGLLLSNPSTASPAVAQLWRKTTSDPWAAGQFTGIPALSAVGTYDAKWSGTSILVSLGGLLRCTGLYAATTCP